LVINWKLEVGVTVYRVEDMMSMDRTFVWRRWAKERENSGSTQCAEREAASRDMRWHNLPKPISDDQ